MIESPEMLDAGMIGSLVMTGLIIGTPIGLSLLLLAIDKCRVLVAGRTAPMKFKPLTERQGFAVIALAVITFIMLLCAAAYRVG
jgi:hypothetical protein